jgi:hypothetical protein
MEPWRGIVQYNAPMKKASDAPSATDTEKSLRLAANPAAASVADVESLPEALALEVLEAAVRAKAVPLAEALTASKMRALAKAAKRALYQLRSAGVPVPEKPVAPAPSTKASVPEPAEEFPCLLSPVTGSGEQALLLVRPQRGGGLENFQVVITDEAGMVSLDRGEASRGKFRKLVRDFRGQPGAPVEIGREQARELLGVAAGVNQATRTPYPQGADDALRAFDAKPTAAKDLPAIEADDERLAARGHTLHQEPEMAPWLPPESELRLLAKSLDEAAQSPLELTPAQRHEQQLHKAVTGAHAFFTPAMKRLYGQRLWRMGDYFERTGRAEAGRIARAEARRLFHGAPGESRFAEALFEKVIALTERARAGKELPKPGERLGPTPAPSLLP